MGGVDENKAIARREIEEFEGKGKVSLGPELFAPDYQLTFGGAPPMDHVGHEQLLRGLRGAFPDLSIHVAGQVASDDRVANHWTAQGTHRGAFEGIAATGKTVTFTGNNLMHMADGRIRALWGQLDAVGLLTQLGAIPGPVPEYERSPAQAAAPARAPLGGANVVRRFVEKFNAGRLEDIADEFDDGYILDFPGGPTGAGKDGIRNAVRDFRTAFPDLHFATEDLFEEADRVAWRWTMTGTHKGSLGPFPPSGSQVRLAGISMFELRNGHIVRDRVRADMAGLLAQIGAIPAAAH
ncbi:MAG TPA: ester cyclase [Xanthobacteraceae bacterium]|nr:ester cyclase [Xanthobacteraceae bacterium]